MKYPTYKFFDDKLIPAQVELNNKTTPVWMQQRWQDGKYAVYVRQNGCGHCCASIICNLLGVEMTPYKHIEHCVKLWGEPSISPSGNQQYYFLSITGLSESLNSLGIPCKFYGHKNQGVDKAVNHIYESLKQGKQVIFISSPSDDFPNNPFSKGDHYVLAVGLTEGGKILIANSSTNGIYDIGEGIQEVDLETIKRSLNPIAEPIYRTWGELEDLHLGIGYIVIE
ncbi:MAG: hypothetical protein E7358_07005 [Clostridiales bacterium]|nr:hypothetical protein [Clostridiales bacterium]